VEGRLYQVPLALPECSVREKNTIAQKETERLTTKSVAVVVQVILLEDLPDAIRM
jgi:hypothetical protein